MTSHQSPQPESPSMPALLSVVEAAKRLGIGTTLFYELLYRGELRSLLIGNRRLVPASDVERYIESRASNHYEGGRH